MELETKSFLFLISLDSFILLSFIILSAIIVKCKGRRNLTFTENKDYEISLLAPGLNNRSVNSDPYSEIEGITEGMSQAPSVIRPVDNFGPNVRKESSIMPIEHQYDRLESDSKIINETLSLSCRCHLAFPKSAH